MLFRSGRGCPSAFGLCTTEASSIVGQCLRIPGALAQLMVDRLQRACLRRGCLNLYQLQRILRLIPSPAGWVESLAHRLDGMGLSITGATWVESRRLLLSEAVWPVLMRSLKALQNTQSPNCSGPSRDSIQLCLAAIQKLAAAQIMFVLKLYLGHVRWMPQQDVRTRR